jgi:preprotein translocase subunit SecD
MKALRLKILLILAVLFGAAYAIATMPINLGLDLKGGAYILLEADLDKVVADRNAALRDAMRTELRGNREKGVAPLQYSNLSAGATSATVTLRSEEDAAEFRRRMRRATNNEADITVEGLRVRVAYSASGIEQVRTQVMVSSIEIIRRRIDSLGTKEPSIQRQGENRIMIQVPGADNPERVKELVGQTAKMTFHMVEGMAEPGVPVPLDSMVIDGLIIKKAVAVAGDTLKDSRVQFDSTTGQPAVTTTFDSVGARAFARLTQENVGRQFAIVLDGRILSAPTIQEPILGGTGQITGGFNAQTANDLASMLRSGALPTELHVVEERTVGAGLGADSISKGTFASILALALTLFAMFAIYGLLGLFANIALLINISLVFAGLALFGATLTLPGIAGIALNIGMSIDAMILIFERMREEKRLGVSTLKSVENGFSNAFSAIIDVNLTTLACGLILLEFGTGPVKGFAVTLILGIVTSLFSNITCFRVIMEVWARTGKPKEIRI